uniref:G-protein coupled receptors family 1 profile domain-containing protein n=1 Tax=Paramormyrops kingsleyae TaxID=1676925 RepID=A0A3B3RP32_9TELE
MNSANGTETESSAEEYIFASGTLKLISFTIGIIGVFGFCNNIIVLVLYYKFNRLRTPTNLLLVNITCWYLFLELTLHLLLASKEGGSGIRQHASGMVSAYSW